MAIIKIGEMLEFNAEKNILSPKEALSDKKIAEKFIKMAKKLKRLAPKANDFLYGHAIMMHSAEAALIDQSTGEPIKNKNGEPVKGYFEKIKVNGQDSIKWISPDGIKAYKNHNGDIFPEEELKKAYKLWVGKPLCRDHVSDSVDGIRGIIVDTYYDPKFKRVHALFALDKKNYADLARKVATGYATSVSMGTAVGRSVCFECGNVAKTEKDYCKCVRARTAYGEINLDLNPIELSLVVNGADQLAKIKNIIASMNNYVNKKQDRINEMLYDRCVNPTELQSLADSINEMQIKLNNLLGINKSAATKNAGELGEVSKAIEVLQDQIDREEDPDKKEKIKSKIDQLVDQVSEPKRWPPSPTRSVEPSFSSISTDDTPHSAPGSLDPSARFADANKEGDEVKQGALNELSLLRSKIEDIQKTIKELKVSKEEKNMNSARLRARAKARRAYWLGGGGVNEPTPGKAKYEKEEADKIRDKEDKQMVGELLDTGSEGLHPGDEEKLRDAGRDGLNLSKAELEDRAMKRRAYFLGGGGVNEPTPGKAKYEKEEADKIRDKEDKHLETYDMGGTDGMVPGDKEVKEKLLRAKLRAKFTKVADSRGNLVKESSRWDVFAGDQLVLSATGSEVYEDELNDNWSYFASKEYGQDIIKHIRNDGLSRVAYLLKGAQDPMAPAPMPPAEPAPVDMSALPLPAEPAPAVPEVGKKVDVKEPKDDIQQKINEALAVIEEKLEEIRELSSGAGDKGIVDIDVNVDKKKEDGAGEQEAPLDTLTSSRKDMLKIMAMMDASADELALASEALESSSDSRLISMAKQAIKDSEMLVAQAELVIQAKKKKEKKDDVEEDEKEDKKEKKSKKDKEDDVEEDEKEDKKEKKSKKDKEDDVEEDEKEDKKEKKSKKDKEDDVEEDEKEDKKEKKSKKDKEDDVEEDEKEDKKEKKSKKDEKETKAQELLNRALKVRAENRAALLSKAMDDEECGKCDKCHKPLPVDKKCQECDAPMAMADDCESGDCLDVVEDTQSVVAARKSEREKLVSQAAEKILHKYELDLGEAETISSDVFFDAHPAKGPVTELTHTKTPEAKVETIVEVHEKMREVAEAQPKVREAAAVLQEMIVEGKVKVSEIDKLVAEGKVDSEAASYWKKYFAQASEAGSFGADLSKEFVSKKKEANVDEYKIKVRRAYDLGLQAQERGIIGSTRAALDSYVNEILELPDAAFESIKRITSSLNTGKKSGVLPKVGLNATSEAMTVTASTDTDISLTEQLAKLGWK